MENIAQFRFLEHKIIKSIINIDPSREADTRLQVNLESRTMEMADENKMRLDLTVNVSDKDKVLDISVTLSAIFEYDEILSDEAKKGFFSCNAPAIVFPFLRAYVNSLTALSGIKPVVLPTFNFSSRN